MEEFKRIVAEFFGVKPTDLRHSTKMGDIKSWDSLGHITLVLHLESVYNVAFETDSILKLLSLESMYSYIKDHSSLAEVKRI